MTLVPDLTVLDNMLLPYAPLGPGGIIRRRAAEAEVAAHFEALGLSDIDLDDEIRELDLPVRQKIEIARAIFRKPQILLLDEPTSTLSGRDVDWLGDLIAAAEGEGVTIVFISHRLPRSARLLRPAHGAAQRPAHRHRPGRRPQRRGGDRHDRRPLARHRHFPERPPSIRPTQGAEMLSVRGLAAGRLKQAQLSTSMPARSSASPGCRAWASSISSWRASA